MNTRTITTAFLLVWLVTLSSLNAQSKQRETTRETRHEELGERIGTMVEDVIARIGKSLSLREEKDLFSVDSLKRRSRRGIKIDSDEKSVTYEGTVRINEDEIIRSNVIVKGGDLTIYGKVEGDVLVVGGDLHMKDGAWITGNAKVINGEIFEEEGSTIDGYIDRSSTRASSYREDEDRYRRSSFRLNAPWVSETTNLDNFIFRYNRVEGIFLGLGSEKRYYWDGWKDYSVYGSIGWGFKSHRWRGNLGLSRQFLVDDGHLLELGVEGHSLTETKDHWIISQGENTAAAFLIHEDYRDYFGREGYGINAGYAMQTDDVTLQVKAEFLGDRYSSLDNRTEWSLFGGNKVFRPNPLINDGEMTSILASAGLSTFEKTLRGPEGWSIYGTGEFAKRRFGGEFSFDQYVLDVRRFQPLGRYDNFNVRLRVGTSEGVIPAQKLFEAGGLGTLHAFPFKSEAGNRMILLNAEYIINGDFLGELDFWPSSFMSGLNFILLSDAGYFREVSPQASWTEGFEDLRWNDFKHNVGVGLSNRSGSMRLAFVWRTDRSENAKFVFRFVRPF
jgi:cytoskeletal protein CcmA (bactofilin family)